MTNLATKVSWESVWYQQTRNKKKNTSFEISSVVSQAGSFWSIKSAEVERDIRGYCEIHEFALCICCGDFHTLDEQLIAVFSVTTLELIIDDINV